MSVYTFLRTSVSWQQFVNVYDTVEKAPRWRKLASCSKVRYPVSLNTSNGGYGTPETFLNRRVPIKSLKRLLGQS
jgi:hypothetical protein